MLRSRDGTEYLLNLITLAYSILHSISNSSKNRHLRFENEKKVAKQVSLCNEYVQCRWKFLQHQKSSQKKCNNIQKEVCSVKISRSVQSDSDLSNKAAEKQEWFCIPLRLPLLFCTADMLHILILLSDFFQSFAYTVCIQIFFFPVHHRNYLICRCIQKTKYIHTLSSIAGLNINSLFTPAFSFLITICQVYTICEIYFF